MEQTPFELTPQQKGMLASLSRETGKPIPALLAEALEVLQEHERTDHRRDEVSGTTPPAMRSPSILDIFREAREDIPEEWKALPEDLAAQHDHYIYGTSKRLYETPVCRCVLPDCPSAPVPVASTGDCVHRDA